MNSLVGRTIGKYQVIEALDETVGTVVYKGFNPTINRYVIIYTLKPEFIANEAILNRFLAQNDIAGKIHHPHIAQLIDFGTENGINYRVFLYGVNGRLQENRHWFNKPDALLRLTSDLCSAVSYIHQFGYVHLKITPTNIFLDEKNSPLLGDFSIVKSATAAGVNAYDSPEARNNLPVDSRSDIYSLGALVYELLTGAPPDPQRIVPLRSLRPDLPADVEKVLFKALAVNPQDRFQSADMFNSALVAAFRTPAAAAPGMVQATPMVQVNVEDKKNGWVTALLTLLILIVVGAIVYFAVFQKSDKAQPTAAPEATTQPTAPPEATSRPEATQRPPRPERPPIQWPEIDGLPDWPICNSIQAPVALAMVGVVMSKAARRKKR